MAWRNRSTEALRGAENQKLYPLLAVVLKEKRRLQAMQALLEVLAWHGILFEAGRWRDLRSGMQRPTHDHLLFGPRLTC